MNQPTDVDRTAASRWYVRHDSSIGGWSWILAETPGKAVDQYIATLGGRAAFSSSERFEVKPG